MAKAKDEIIESDLYGMAWDEYRIRLMGHRERWHKYLLKPDMIFDIDWELFEQMCLRGVPIQQMCFILQINQIDLDTSIQDKYNITLEEYVASARATMLAIIRNLQLTKSDSQMLKHLGEWYLEQRQNGGEEQLIKELEIKIYHKAVNEETVGSLSNGEDLW